VAVLVRTNDQAAGMQRALRRLRIPSVLRSAESVLRSAEACELLAVLQAVHEPGDAGKVRGALATSLIGLSGDGIAALRDDDRAWESWAGRVRDWREVWDSGGFIQLFRRLLDTRTAPGAPPAHARLLGLVDGERRMTNLLHLAELVHRAEVRGRLGSSGVVRWLNRQMVDPSQEADAGELRLESDELAVQLVTIHKSKGLQYPVVYCPFLWQRRRKDGKPPFTFHDPGRGDEAVLDLGSDELSAHHALAERESLAENQRLLYVALTRAEHLCVTVWGAFNNAGSSPLGYLLHRPPGVTDPGPLDTRFRPLTDDRLRADLQDLVGAANGAIAVDDLSSRPGEPFLPEATEHAPLRPRVARRTLHLPWWPSSFSRLAASGEPLTPEEAEGLDRDREDDPTDAGRPGGGSGEIVPLSDFPRGARPGSCIHEIYEDLDFQAPEALAELVRAKLRRYGLSADRWGDLLTGAIRDSLLTPLDPGGGLTLASISMARRVNELEFIFPVALDGGQRLTTEGLARVLASHGGHAARYAEHARHLRFGALRGYLRGFIDLTFEHQGRWYVADYKSNWLGEDRDCYGADGLWTAMTHHHYVLQYLLYLVALHRYLRVRLADYDPERHLGGAYYLFLRGMDPATGPSRGVFVDRPPASLIVALSALLDGEAAP
jgi:exodeoxyribonuclease V beta subunit